jgi:hypothetical protein
MRRWWCTSLTGELGRRGKGQMTMGWSAARADDDDGL